MSEQSNAPEVPAGAEVVSDFQTTPLGYARQLAWTADYDNVRAGGDPLDQETPADVVRVVALQDSHGNVGGHGIEIDVAGHFSVTEALLIAAAIKDASQGLPTD